MASSSIGNTLFFFISILTIIGLILVNARIVLVNVANSVNSNVNGSTSSDFTITNDKNGNNKNKEIQYNRIDVAGDSSPVSRAESLKAVKKVFRDAQPRLGQVSVKNSVVESKVTPKGWDVTFTSQGTMIRYHYFPILLRRWDGPLSITIHLKEDEVKEFTERIKADQFPSRLSIVQYISTQPSVYPINKLRNLAIQNVQTDHFWLTDLDMWPSRGLYKAILSLPASALTDEKLAIIVPAYEIHNSKCQSFAECTAAIDPIFPETKQSLITCIQQRKCSTFRPWDQLHDYHFNDWYSSSYNKPLTPVHCFKGNTQEPYVVVKKTNSLPSFDERFINYAYNKVQWLEHLRYRGYAFSIITDGFAVDVPHPFSSLRKKFMETREQTKQTLNLDVYNNFLNELHTNERDQSVVKYCFPICFNKHIK